MTFIQTYNGDRFDFDPPNPDAIDIESIAHALSMQCRFNGHTLSFYSVAEHCVRAAREMCNRRPGDPEAAFQALMHDAAEAYTGDIVKPLKSLLGEPYDRIEKMVEAAVRKKFAFVEDPEIDAVVKEIDIALLATEVRDLLGPKHPDWPKLPDPLPDPIKPYIPEGAKYMFLNWYTRLEKARRMALGQLGT